jgi:hypothetical protein
MPPLDKVRTEIWARKGRYCRLVDTRQWEEFATLLLPDVDVDISDDVPAEHGDGKFTGREQLVVRNTQFFMERGERAHHVHGSEIAFDDADNPSAIWSRYDRVIFPNSGPVPHDGKTSHGFYHERYVRTADGWKIAALRVQRSATTIETKPLAS